MAEIPFKHGANRVKDLKFILSHLPQRNTYLEPFGGTGAVLLAKQRVKNEHYNDIDSNWYAFFKAARDHSEELLRKCLLSPHSEQDYIESNKEYDGDNIIEQARRWYVNVTQSLYNKPYLGWSREYKKIHPQIAIREALEPKWKQIAKRINGVYIHNTDALTLIPKVSDVAGEELVIYCEPTYKNPLAHDKPLPYTITDDQIRMLSAVLHNVSGYVAISGPDTELMNELYGDWHRWLVPDEKVSITNDQTYQRNKEVLWTNQIYQQDTML